ncbi:hypothetical protein [Streptomyces chattanoogensis]|uniref:hypothetical protein n=1 Tax=Streptomyces chattanoogensis TaxID=66876 RepID=UPI00146FE035|nr:hypothetical protein [Streptomyces chattanoogensis]
MTGIDAEPEQPLPEGVLEAIALPGEIARLRRLRATEPGVCRDRSPSRFRATKAGIGPRTVSEILHRHGVPVRRRCANAASLPQTPAGDPASKQVVLDDQVCSHMGRRTRCDSSLKAENPLSRNPLPEGKSVSSEIRQRHKIIQSANSAEAYSSLGRNSFGEKLQD